MSARCTFKSGRFECGGVLEPIVDRGGYGKVTYACRWCERRAAGLCRDCPAPVDGRVGQARRCAACRHARDMASKRKYERENRETVNRRQRRRVQAKAKADPSFAAGRADYMRAWRLANPEKVKAQHRREGLLQRPSKLAYQRKQRRKYRRYDPQPHACVAGCGTMLDGYAKKCEPCKTLAQAAARRAITTGAVHTRQAA